MGARILQWVLRLLPGEFRDGYAREIARAVADQSRELSGTARRGALAALWWATALDVICTAPGQHWDILRRDLTFAWRAMLGRPAHAITAVVVLAIAFAANASMFAVADAVLLAPLDYREADRLVTVREAGRGEPGPTGYLTFLDLETRTRSFSALVAATQSTATFTGGPLDAERVNVMRVSRDYFDMVGVGPELGRAFTDAEDQPGAARRVMILSDALWRRRFAADPAVLGRVVDVSGVPFTVVGVMPRGFDDLIAGRLYGDAAAWTPLGYDPAASFACRTCRHLRVFGRLRPGVSVAAAEADATAVLSQLAVEHPASYAGPRAQVDTLGDLFLGPVRPAVLVLWGGVVVLLLVTCVNVAGLLLIRASERTTEVAVRAALGVTRGRLIRQLATEAGLLGALGAVTSLAPAWLALWAVRLWGPADLPRLADVTFDARTIAAAWLMALVSALLFGAAPVVLLLRRRDSPDALRGAGCRTDGVRTWRVRTALVAGSVALAAVLLTGTGVLVRSVARLLAVEAGLRSEGVLTMKVWAGGARFNDGDTAAQVAAVAAFYDEMLARARALPGVRAAAAVSSLPLSSDRDSFGFHVAGLLTNNPEDAPDADRFAVAGDYLAALGIPVVAGRGFDARDGPGRVPVALVNRSAVTSVFGGEDPIGRQVMLGTPTAVPRTIVGVVGDVRHRGLDRPAGIQVYVPQAQWAYPDTLMTVVVRTDGAPLALAPPLRAVVRDIDATQPVTDVRPLADVVAATTSTRRFVTVVLAIFASAAVLLAVVGLYGVLSVMVAQRRVEIGIRLALGARADAIRRMVFLSGVRPVLLGAAIGVPAAVLALGAADSLLYGVRPADAPSLFAATALLIGAGAAACVVPARRASRIDPATSLRAE